VVVRLVTTATWKPGARRRGHQERWVDAECFLFEGNAVVCDSEAELLTRRAAWKAPAPKITRDLQRLLW
jgi:hypothetical protein